MSEYHVREVTVYEVIEVNEDGECNLMADFESERDANNYLAECEAEG